MSEYCDIIEGEEYKPAKATTFYKKGGRQATLSLAQKEAQEAGIATYDLYEIKRFYIQGHTHQWISDNTMADTVTFKPISARFIGELAVRYKWAPQKAAYKVARDEVDKEWVDKAAKQAAEAYAQGVIAGKAEQTAYYEKSFTERLTDTAETQAQKLMDQGQPKQALELVYQIERLRRMKNGPVKIKPVSAEDADDTPEDDDLTMQLLDQAVAETEKQARGR